MPSCDGDGVHPLGRAIVTFVASAAPCNAAMRLSGSEPLLRLEGRRHGERCWADRNCRRLLPRQLATAGRSTDSSRPGGRFHRPPGGLKKSAPLGHSKPSPLCGYIEFHDVYVGSGCAAVDAGAAISSEHSLPLPPPRSTARTAELAPIAPAPGLDQAAAADAGAEHLEPSDHAGRFGLILGPVHGHRERDHGVDPARRVSAARMGDPGAAHGSLCRRVPFPALGSSPRVGTHRPGST